MGGPMRCWDCNQELDTGQVEKDAAHRERLRLTETVGDCARLLREQGDPGWKAVDALHQELSALRGL
jgi:hypothetical protein